MFINLQWFNIYIFIYIFYIDWSLMYTKWLEINFCLTQEQLVVVHLSGIIDTEYLKKCDPTNCKILVIKCFPLIVCLGKFLYKQVFYSQKSPFSQIIIDVYTEWYDIWKMIWYICNMGYDIFVSSHAVKSHFP